MGARHSVVEAIEPIESDPERVYDESMSALSTGLITGSLGSLVTMGFGIWHFFVPRIWKWYSYIPDEARELVPAIRATNFFFSLSLVLFGALNLLFLWYGPKQLFYMKTVNLALILLWGSRVAMQVAYPQGSMSASLQYGMLAAFVVTLGLFVGQYAWLREGVGP